ncbi:hypothetical protein QT971_25150 [Microcoleus sp. herbarium19]|uniref:hypothetical protein n=1 Tax=unclassified Microcoleus TaxID=2642155 RepID=UPI002FD6D8B0
MATTVSANLKILTTTNTHELDTAAEPIAKAPKHHFVARWLMDENSKLYCQWVIED